MEMYKIQAKKLHAKQELKGCSGNKHLLKGWSRNGRQN